MKKRICKWIAAAMALALTLSLSACGSTPQTSGDGNSADPEEQITLTLWHSFGSTVSQDVIDDFIEIYEAENPNIKIVQENAQIEEYQFRKLKVAVTNGSQGDVFLSYGAGYSKPFVDAGACLPLSDYLEADNTAERLQDGVLEYFTYDGEVYGLPIKKWAGVLYCNRTLFEQYDLEYPETWDDLLHVVEVFRANGVTPMALGAKDGWHIGMYQNALAVRTAGTEYSNEAVAGEASLDTPEIARSAELLMELVNAGAFDEGTLAISADEANMEFNLGNIPMYYSGSWTAAECENPENNIQGIIDVVPMPTVPDGKGDANQYLGGAIDCYMVNSKTKYPDEAVKFAIALTEYQSNEGYKLGDGVTAWKSDIDESEVNPVLLKINELTESATGYMLAWDTFLTGSAIDAHYNLLQELVGGAITPEQFAQQMEEANQIALAEAE